MSPVAAIDCGTNSIRLLVARQEGPGELRDLDRRMLSVRLGEGVDRTGRLSAAALDRAFDACRHYRDILDSLGATRIRFVATSASRDAENLAEFVTGVESIVGVSPEVISGDEEADLSFSGATRGERFEYPALVFDIGGGSTEFILGTSHPTRSASVDMGCVRFTERFARHDPMSAPEVADVRLAANRMLDSVAAGMDLASARSVVGLAGTVTTVTALALGLREYRAETIHGAEATAAQISVVADRLVAMTAAQRAALPVMHPGRADVIAVGALLLDVIMKRSRAETLIASEHDILDGIAWSLLDSDVSD